MPRIYVPYGLPAAGGVLQRPAVEPPLPPPPFPMEIPDCEFRPQIAIKSGGMTVIDTPDAEISSVSLDDHEADGVRMVCDKPCINGFHISESSRFTIKDSVIDFAGDGVNDFTGRGAGVQAADTATVILENTSITTAGVIRPCTYAGDCSTLIVRSCELIGIGGIIPPDAPKVIGPGMKEPPPPLELGGNCRTHLSTGNSHAYFYDSKIIADGWAALSVDGCAGDLYLEANRCDIIVKNIGYGVYADFGSNVVINDSKILASHGLIIAGQARGTLRDCQTDASRYIVMIHSVMGSTHDVSELTLHGGRARSSRDCIWVKSANANIDLRGVDLHSESGCLIRSTYNPDPHATQVADFEEVYGVKAVLSDMVLAGDILHEDHRRAMALSLKHTRLTGAIQNAAVALDQASCWTADEDSNVALISAGPSGLIDALPGVTIRARSDRHMPGEYPLPSGGMLVVI